MGEMKTEKKQPTIRKVPVECYSRVVGYFRPSFAMNHGKQEEFWEREEMLKQAKHGLLSKMELDKE